MSICMDCGKRTGWPLLRCYCCTIDNDDRAAKVESVDWQSRAIAAEKRLAELDRFLHTDGGDFARHESEQQDNSWAWWFNCHKCGELIEGTEDIGNESNGEYFKCACGQEYIASTHLILHAMSTEGQELLDQAAALAGNGATHGERRWLVELEPGVWLGTCEGDPSRTCQVDNANRYVTETLACAALDSARKYRPFVDAKIVEVES